MNHHLRSFYQVVLDYTQTMGHEPSDMELLALLRAYEAGCKATEQHLDPK